MIFVTTGTDHHPFDRLVREVDILKEKGMLRQEIFIQSGSSDYKPRACEYAEFISFDQMVEKIKRAQIIITHGGPGSIMLSLDCGKVPIAVPRRKRYGEAVDDHQVSFVKKLTERGQILSVDKIQEIEYKIKNYREFVGRLRLGERDVEKPAERASRFALALEKICESLTAGRKR